MKDAISTKLLVMLGFAVAVAGFGAWRLLGTEEAPGDLGFGPDTQPSAIVAAEAGGLEPIEESLSPSSRNPFERVDLPGSDPAESGDVNGEGSDVDGEGSDVDGEGSDEGAPDTTVPVATTAPPTLAPLPEPVFPDPNAVDDESSNGSRGR